MLYESKFVAEFRPSEPQWQQWSAKSTHAAGISGNDCSAIMVQVIIFQIFIVRVLNIHAEYWPSFLKMTWVS